MVRRLILTFLVVNVRIRPPRELDVMPLISFCSYFRMMPAVTSVRGAQFVKVTLVGLMTVLPRLITGPLAHACRRIEVYH